MKNQKLKDNCNGCRMQKKNCDIPSRFLNRLTAYDVCPCGICIVKVMCDTGNPCEEYSRFYHDISNNRRG